MVKQKNTQADEVIFIICMKLIEQKQNCMSHSLTPLNIQLKLEPTTARPSYEPRGSFVLKVTGDPEAKVGLVAVDRGVYVLNNKHRLTQKKAISFSESYV